MKAIEGVNLKEGAIIMADVGRYELRVLGSKEVQEKTSLDASEIEQGIYEGGFPQQVSLRGKTMGWLEADIQEWMWVQVLKASWGGTCRWSDDAYLAVRRPEAMWGANIDNLNQLRGACGVLCQHKISALCAKNRKEVDPFAAPCNSVKTHKCVNELGG
jgi:predicted DNA-binding transcriptional regulator AlpA